MKRIVKKISEIKNKFKKCTNDLCQEEREKARAFREKHDCICDKLKEIQNHAKIDEMVWRMVGAAHEITEMQRELKEYYPEMIPFLNYIVTHYPALKENK